MEVGAHKRIALYEEITQQGSPDQSWERYLRSQRYHCTMLGGSTALSTLAMTAGRLFAIPFLVSGQHKFIRIAINVTTLLAGNARLGIYSNKTGDVYPETLLLDAGEVNTGTAGLKELVINNTLDTGLYWLVVVCSSASTLRAAAVASTIAALGLDGTLATTPGNGFYAAITYGALPNPYPSGATVNVASLPVVALFKE